MELSKLDNDTYAGRRFTVRYRTQGYYDILPTAKGFEIQYRPFDQPVEKQFQDRMFEDWLESPVAYGAFEDGVLLGYVEGSPEQWNNRYRISNICIFESCWRHRGIGGRLMDKILSEAKESGVRMVVLETQSCNENAIAFYRKCGFEIIGFDLYSYTNEDPQRHEVRLEMGMKLR